MDTSRCPGCKLSLQSLAVAPASTRPICAKRRASARGADTNWLNGTAPPGRPGSASPGPGRKPMGRCGLVGGGVEIVAERCAKRLLVAGLDVDLVDDRAPVASLRRQQLQERGKLGLELLGFELGRGSRGERHRLAFACLLAGSFGAGQLGFQLTRRAWSAGTIRRLAQAAARRCLRSRQAWRALPRFPRLRRGPRHARFKLGLLGLDAAPLGPGPRQILRRRAQAPFSFGQSGLRRRGLPRAIAAPRRRASLAVRAGAPPAQAAAGGPRLRRSALPRGRGRAWLAPAASRARPGAALARCSSRSSASRSTLKRCSTAARAASASRSGWSFSAASACCAQRLSLRPWSPARRGKVRTGTRLPPARHGRRRRSSANDAAAPRPRGSCRRFRDNVAPGAPAASVPAVATRAAEVRSPRRSRLVSVAFRRSSASCLRLCRPAMPAASSSTRRRSCGGALTISPMRPCRTNAGELAPVAASSNRRRISRARASLPFTR